MPLDNPRNDELQIPWSLPDDHLHDDQDTEQHKFHRGKKLHKRSIRNYRHATTKWGAALESFKSMWFALVISTGGLATILNGPFAYPAHWLRICASILYIFELLLFTVFTILMLIRWTLYPHVAIRRALRDPSELGSYAIPPIALMTIGALTASQVSTASWGGHAFTIVAYVLWCVGVVWVFSTAVVVLCVLFYTGNQVDRVMTPVLFMEPVGLATAGTEALFITIFSEGMRSRMAVPMVVVGYFAVGVALFMAMILYTMYFHRLFAVGWSKPLERPVLFILSGPCGQLSTAFQLLGESASAYMRFAEYKPSAVYPPMYGTFWRQETAQGLDSAGLLLSLLLLGFDHLCLCIAVIGVMDHFIKRQAKHSLTWWSIVFPTVTLASAWLELGFSMDSPMFRGLTAALMVILCLFYFGNLGFTIWGVADGSLIFGQTQVEIEDELMKKAHDKKMNGEV